MRNEFLDIKKKTIIVQSYFRMQKALKEYKIISDQRQVAAILIQSWVRRFLAGKKYQKLKQDVHDRYQISVHLHQRAAAEVIQAAWRGHRVRLAYKQKLFEAQCKLQQTAAIMIQKHWRGHKERSEFLKLKENLKSKKKLENSSAIVLQKWIRRFLAMKHLERLKNEKINRAATLIKAAWRGYKARLALKDLVIAKKLAEVQRRVSEAHKNVTEDKKLCNRTAYALDYLFTYKDMGMLILALNNLNVTLR